MSRTFKIRQRSYDASLTHSTQAFELNMRPERGAGGFARDDSLVQFFTRTNALLTPDSITLDFGAGRGRSGKQAVPLKAELTKWRGRVRHHVGVDVDDVVLQNTEVDEAHVIQPGKMLPFTDASFDLILCDWVLEHIDDTASFSTEVGRLLRPGGWLCGRTPNRWGYVALGAQLVSEQWHERVLQWLVPRRRSQDTFPKFYHINTVKKLREHFSPADFLHCSYAHNPEPAYHGFRSPLYRIVDFYQATAPDAMKTNLMVFIQKSPLARSGA